MTYPPPPGLVFLAFEYGKITKAEFDHMIKLWKEKRMPEPSKDGDA